MDEATRKALRREMGVPDPRLAGRLTSMVSVPPSDLPRFSLATPIDLPSMDVQTVARRIERVFAAEGFSPTRESLPGIVPIGAWSQIAPSTGVMAADRDVARLTEYDRWTNRVCLGLLAMWVGASVVTVLVDRPAWAIPVFGGWALLGVPAFVVFAYRGSGYDSLVAVAGLEALGPMPPGGSGDVLGPFPIRVTFGVGRVRSRSRRHGQGILSIQAPPDAARVLGALRGRWEAEQRASDSGTPLA